MKDDIEDIMQSLRQGLENMKKVATDFEKTTDGVSAETRKGEQKKIDALKEQNKLLQESVEATEEQKKEANEVLKSIESQNKILKEQYRVTGRINQEFAVTGNKYKDFLMTTAAQYNYAQDIAKEYRGLVKSLGLGSESSKLMTKSFKEALPTVLEMGLSQEDLGRVYETMAENSGRITPISKEDAEAIASVAAGTGMMASDAASMGESFSLMGVSATEMEESLMETYKSAQSMGLNATKVIKTLQTNMSSMQSYSFAGGVKGMTEMAKQAVKMRLDVSDVLAMSDKFYQPEAAIEAAANLQMLGGDIAEAFGDPFETMYLARNKPEELAKKVGEMTENMMQFNEETGEYEFPAEVRMQLQSAGEQLGINTDKMIEMARQTSKIKDIKMKFNMSGLDEDVKDSLASLATFDKTTGEYVIKHDGKELGLDSINEGMAEEIMKANQSEEQTFRDIAVNTQTMSEKMTNFLESQKARVVGAGVDIYELTAAEMEKPFDQLRQGMQATTDEWIARGGEYINEMFATTETSSVLDDTMKDIGDLGILLKDKTIKSFDEFTQKMDIFNEKLDDVPITSKPVSSDGVPIEVVKTGNDVASFPGQNGRILTGDFGSLSINNKDLVVAGDPNKLIGGNSSDSSKLEFGNLNITGRIELVSPDGSTNNMDMASLKPSIEKIVINHLNGTFRNGGVPSSKESTDYMAS
jgi:hypothetical protein